MLALIGRLAKQSAHVASLGNRMHAMIAADGNVPTDQQPEEIKALRSEIRECMGDWDRTCEEVEKHRASHGC